MEETNKDIKQSGFFYKISNFYHKHTKTTIAGFVVGGGILLSSIFCPYSCNERFQNISSYFQKTPQSSYSSKNIITTPKKSTLIKKIKKQTKPTVTPVSSRPSLLEEYNQDLLSYNKYTIEDLLLKGKIDLNKYFVGYCGVELEPTAIVIYKADSKNVIIANSMSGEGLYKRITEQKELEKILLNLRVEGREDGNKPNMEIRDVCGQPSVAAYKFSLDILLINETKRNNCTGTVMPVEKYKKYGGGSGGGSSGGSSGGGSGGGGAQ